MEVHFPRDLERKLAELATSTGRAADDLVQEVVAGYFDELADIREILDRRYDDLKSGRAQAIDGEEALRRLRRKSEQRRRSESG